MQKITIKKYIYLWNLNILLISVNELGNFFNNTTGIVIHSIRNDKFFTVLAI